MTPDIPEPGDQPVAAPPSLAYKATKNALWSMVSFGWPLAVALLVTPILVGKLGADLYGVLTVVSITTGFFGILDLGMGGAAVRQVAAYSARHETENVNRVVGTALAFYLLVGLLVGSLIVLLADTFVTSWLTVPEELHRVAIIAFTIAGPTFLVSMLNSAFGSIPQAIQRYDVTTRITIGVSLVTNVAAVTLLWLGKGLIELQIAGLAVATLMLPVYYRVARKLIPTLRVRLRLDVPMFKELFSFGGYFLLSSIGVLLLYQLDKLLVGNLLGIAAVTYYVVPSSLARQVQGLTAAATNVVFPMSSQLFETDQRDSLAKLYRQGTRMVYILITVVAVPLAVFADRFLLHWMGPEMASRSSLTMVLLVVTYYLLASTSTAWGIAFGAGRAKLNAVYTLLMAATDLGLFFVLVPRFGVPGAAASYLIAAVVGVPLLISTIEKRVLSMSGVEFTKVYWRIGLTAIVQVGLALLLRRLCVNLVATAGVMALSGASFVVLYRLFGFVQESDKQLFRQLWNRLRGQSAT